MNIPVFIQTFKSLVKAAYGKRNDPKKWAGWIEFTDADDNSQTIKLDGKFKSVTVELTGLRFEFEADGKKVVLEARPNLHKMDVYINDEHDPEASVVAKYKGTPARPLRAGVDIRPVTYEGEECRFNLRFNG
jgi:hypothetical protein